MNEKDLLQTEFVKPIVIVTYDGNQLIKEKVKAHKYDLKVDEDTLISKIDVLFAFPFAHYQTIKSGIKLNKKVEAQNLKPILKPKDRPIVATKEEYQTGNGKSVKLTMRTGHVLSGQQVANTEYNLILNIADHLVLVYKHGILEYLM